MKKSFGVHRDKYEKAVIRGDKQADKGNPGPGAYLKDICTRSELKNSKCGMMGFLSKRRVNPKKHYGRDDRGSIFENSALWYKDYPGPHEYQGPEQVDLCAIAVSRAASGAGNRSTFTSETPLTAGKNKSAMAKSEATPFSAGSRTRYTDNQSCGLTSKQTHNTKLINTKFRTTHGVILDGKYKRMDLETHLKKTTAEPGPHEYKTEGSAKNKQFKCYGKTVFPKNTRKTFVTEKGLGPDRVEAPGPGNYRMQSDFGLYCPNDITGWT